MRAKEFFIEGYKEVTQKYASAGADPTKITNAIASFKEIVNKNQVKGDERNIDWWGKNKSFDEFNNFVNSVDLSRTKTQVTRKKVVGKSINLIDNDEWLVVIPLDKDASCFYGKNSSWCTSKTNQTYFEEYFGKGITLIYCLNKKTGGMWAIAAAPDLTNKMELFDRTDSSLTKVEFKQQTGMNPTQLVALSTKHKKSIEDERIKAVAFDPWTAWQYAKVVKGRFPEGEKAIASNPTTAYFYARYIIKGRWPEGEKAIASNSDDAYYYARYVLGDPYPKTWRERYLAGETK